MAPLAGAISIFPLYNIRLNITPMHKLSHRVLLAVVLMLAACSGMKMSDFTPANPFAESGSGPTITMKLENGQTVTLILTTRVDELAQFTRVMIERGYYDDQYIYRDVPGDFVLTGKARLSGRPTLAGPYIKDADKMDAVTTGQVGLLIHQDGTVGPEFILRYGRMIRDRETQPANVAVGYIKSGKDVLEAAQKGDKVFRTTIVR